MARAAPADARQSLEDVNLEPAAREQHRRGEPAGPGTNDDDLPDRDSGQTLRDFARRGMFWGQMTS